MLVLSRKKGQSLEGRTISGHRFKVKVLNVKGDKVSLGIEASNTIRVHREEIWDSIDRKVAGNVAGNDAQCDQAVRDADQGRD